MDQSFSKFLNLKSPLLITGETGTGKSHLAREIFEHSNIFKSKFLTAHLASLKEDLIESELFGHRRGAFTGALDNRAGYFQESQGGTLFLDEVGELSLEAQKKLLYLLEEKKFTPVGSSTAIDFCGRIIMATNKNLAEMVQEKKFREDLYFRMKTFQIEIEPIRLNPTKLEKVIDELLEKLKKMHDLPYARLSYEARHFLLNQKWEGNLRELSGALEYALVMSPRNQIEVRDFLCQSNKKIENKNMLDDFLDKFPVDFHAGMEKFEELFLRKALLENAGKVNDTARKLGLSKTTLIQKAKKYRINTLEIRANASALAA